METPAQSPSSNGDQRAVTSTESERQHTRTTNRLYRCDAIVLARMDFGEADRILTVYSRQHGKLRLIAKGARRPMSRLGPHLEFFNYVRLMLARGRDLDVVTGAETVNPHLPIRDDLDAFGHASHMVEILARLTEDRQENGAVFELLSRSLQLLSEGVDSFHATRHFEFVLLGLLGFRPEIYRCIECQEKLDQAPHPFIVDAGGFLCGQCRGRAPAPRGISIEAQKYLRALDRGGLTATVRFDIESPLRLELEGLLGAYLRHVAERDLESLRVWRELGGGLADPV